MLGGVTGVETPFSRRYSVHILQNNPMLPASALRLLLVSNSWLEVRNDRTGKLVECLDLQSPDSPGVRFRSQLFVMSSDCGSIMASLRNSQLQQTQPVFSRFDSQSFIGTQTCIR